MAVLWGRARTGAISSAIVCVERDAPAVLYMLHAQLLTWIHSQVDEGNTSVVVIDLGSTRELIWMSSK